ncbi:MAG: hypothetical protein ACTSXP_13355 [Promethearchaeota archaeon]
MEIEKEGIVIFEPDAYCKALMHVLRFASNSIDKSSWVEVYGWLIGKIEGENRDVHVYDVVPLHHGKDIEVVWDYEVYGRAAEFDEKLYEKSKEDPAYKDMFVVGWYHSHPGLDFFLSTTDINNHLFFQNVNPQAIAIVFDHTKIQQYKNLGFKIFRLDQPGITEEYHEVPFNTRLFTREVLDLIYLLQETVERVQKKQMITMEYGEMPSLFSNLVLPATTDLFSVDKTPPIHVDSLFEKIFNGSTLLMRKIYGDSIVTKIAEEINPAMKEWFSAFIPYMANSLNQYAISLAERVITANRMALGSIHTIATILDSTMDSIGEWMKKQLRSYHKSIQKDLIEFKDHLTDLAKENKNEISDLFNREIDEEKKLVISQFESFNAKLGDLENKFNEKLVSQEMLIKNAIDSFNVEINNLRAKMYEQGESIKNSIGGLDAKISAQGESIKNSIGGLDAKISAQGEMLNKNIVGSSSKMSEQMLAINGAISELKNSIQEQSKRISDLENNNANLLNKLLELKQYQDNISKDVSGLAELINSTADGLTRQVESKIFEQMKMIREEFGNSINNLNQNVERFLKDGISEIVGKTNQAKAEMQNAINEFLKKLDEHKSEFENLVAAKTIKNIQKELKALTDKINEKQ